MVVAHYQRKLVNVEVEKKLKFNITDTIRRWLERVFILHIIQFGDVNPSNMLKWSRVCIISWSCITSWLCITARLACGGKIGDNCHSCTISNIFCHSGKTLDQEKIWSEFWHWLPEWPKKCHGCKQVTKAKKQHFDLFSHKIIGGWKKLELVTLKWRKSFPYASKRNKSELLCIKTK